MATPKPRIKVPETAAKGELITIKAVITHDMENGRRKDADGNLIPRQIINRFECKFNGALVFGCDLQPSMSANPYFEFTAKVEESGLFSFNWLDDNGTNYSAEQSIAVT